MKTLHEQYPNCISGDNLLAVLMLLLGSVNAKLLTRLRILLLAMFLLGLLAGLFMR